jgi:hypothetical protein
MQTDTTDRPATIDEAVESALEFLRLIAQPHDWIEVRLLPMQSSRWFQLADDAGTRSILRWAMNRNRQADKPDNVYFGVNPRKDHGKRGDSNVAVFRALFADFDNGTTPDEALARIREAGLPEPTIVIVSGGGTSGAGRQADTTAALDAMSASTPQDRDEVTRGMRKPTATSPAATCSRPCPRR